MLILRRWAEETPDKPACIEASSRRELSYRFLDERANRVAQLLSCCGLNGKRVDCALLINQSQ